MRYFYDKQLEDALSIISEINNPRVLEIGCGLGSESLFMSMKGASVLGIDINSERLNTATARKKIIEKALGKKLGCEFKNLSVLDLNEEQKYDLIWMEQAFHHLEPREEVVKKISQLLKPEGTVIISEANAWNPLIQIQLLMRRGFKTIKYYTDSDGKKYVYGNERIVMPIVLSKKFKKYNVENIDVKYFRLFPNKKFFDKLFKLEKHMPGIVTCFFTHYNYIGKKCN